jgi:hypothetical protein
VVTLGEFLEARFAEDEADARRRVNALGPHPLNARALAECNAKRRIADEAYRYAATIDSEWRCGHSADAIRDGECEYQRPDELPLLRILAAPYADHPDYRREWAL